jgi:hypothetical protein
MVDVKDIELRSYSTAAAGSLVFNNIWRLQTAGVAVEGTPAEAYFCVLDAGREKLRLALGSGLTWDDGDKSVLVQITNDQVAFIRADTTMEYSFYVVWQRGDVQTIREGAVNALRVA